MKKKNKPLKFSYDKWPAPAQKPKFANGARVKFIGASPPELKGLSGIVTGMSAGLYIVKFTGAAINPWYCSASEIVTTASSQSWMQESI